MRSNAPETLLVRMDLPMDVAERFADVLPRVDAELRDRIHDQLWLRSVFIEQRRRTPRAERDGFNERADRILEALDPGEEP